MRRRKGLWGVRCPLQLQTEQKEGEGQTAPVLDAAAEGRARCCPAKLGRGAGGAHGALRPPHDDGLGTTADVKPPLAIPLVSRGRCHQGGTAALPSPASPGAPLCAQMGTALGRVPAAAVPHPVPIPNQTLCPSPTTLLQRRPRTPSEARPSQELPASRQHAVVAGTCSGNEAAHF